MAREPNDIRRRRLKKALFFAAILATAPYLGALAMVVSGAAAATPEARTAALAALGKPVVAIVLGMGPGGSEPILDRADLAAELWRKGYVSFFITSGGQGVDEVESEAQTLKNALIVLGVSESAIQEEGASTSTRENIALTSSMLAEAGREKEPLIIVTHAFHARRVELLAARAGLAAIVVGAEGPRLDSTLRRTLREGLALIKDFVITK